MKSKLSKTATVVATNDQVSCRLDAEAVILNLNNSTYYGLNSVGARIWELVQKPISLGEIQNTLLNEYQVDSGRCERELLEVLKDMAAAGLIEITDAPPA